MAKFHGHILVQARTLQLVGGLFEKSEVPNSDAQREMLSLLGCVVLAGTADLMVDGTIGEGDADRLRSATERLGLGDKIHWLKPASENIVTASRQAIDIVRLAASWDSLLSGAAAKDWRLGQEDSAAAARWLKETDEIVFALKNVSGKPEEAAALAEHFASSDFNRLRGNKLFSSLAMLESFGEEGSGQLSRFVTSYLFAKPQGRYAMLTGLISEFRPPLLMGFAGQKGGVFAFSGTFSSVARYKQLVWQRALAAISGVESAPAAAPGPSATDEIYAAALARVGLMALHLAKPSHGRADLLIQAQNLSRVPHYGAVLRWITSQETGWQDQDLMSADDVNGFLDDLETKLKTEKFLRTPGKKDPDASLVEILPDTVSAAGRSAVGEAVKSAVATGLGAAIGSLAGPAGAVIGAGLGAGAVGLTKYLLSRVGEQGDYSAGIANLSSGDIAAYDQETIGKKFEAIWAGPH